MLVVGILLLECYGKLGNFPTDVTVFLDFLVSDVVNKLRGRDEIHVSQDLNDTRVL